MTWDNAGIWVLFVALAATVVWYAIGVLLDNRRDRARWRAEDAAMRSLFETIQEDDHDQRTP